MAFLLSALLLVLASCSSTEKTTTKEPVVEKIDRKAIRQTMLTHRRYIGDCYGRALMAKGNEHLKGTIMIGFDIGPDGKAHSAKVLKERSNIDNAQLSKCIIAGLETWDFPVHPKGIDVSVNYPFVFREAPPKNMQNKLDQFQKIKRHQ